MATIADIKPSFMQMNFTEQYELIRLIQESRLTPKKSAICRASKPKKHQMTFKELLVEVRNMHPDDKKKFMLDNGLI